MGMQPAAAALPGPEAGDPPLRRFVEGPHEAAFDLVVVGGGISGAAVAWEAASRGLSVALLERDDFGCATSAATSKNIHGGLRYLTRLDLGIVRESLRERRALCDIAPNLVYPMPYLFVDPPALLRPGLVLYDLLDPRRRATRDPGKRLPSHTYLGRDEAVAREPLLAQTAVRSAALFHDCQNLSPERVVLQFVKSAAAAGALVANHAKVEDFVLDGPGRVAGVVVRDLLRGATATVRARLVVNCAGPWADLLLDVARGRPGGHRLRRSEGIHVVTGPLLRGHAVAASAGGRHFFLIPWRNHTIVGTTDEEYPGDPDDFRVRGAAVDGLLAHVNTLFGRPLLRREDIRYVYGGLRPLVDDAAGSSYTTTRRYAVCDHAPEGIEGLLTVEGGKYTTSRNLAQRVVDRAARKLGRRVAPSRTRSTPLRHCAFDDTEAFVRGAIERHADFPARTVALLARYHGTDCDRVLGLARAEPALGEVLDADGEILAQAVFAVRHELARSLADVFLRRTGLGTAGDPGAAATQAVAHAVARELRWDEERRLAELERLRRAWAIP